MTKIQVDTPRWAVPIFKCPPETRYIGMFGGRGSGKSYVAADYCIESNQRGTDGKIANGDDVACIREVQKSIKYSVKKLLEARIEEMNLTKSYDIQENVIKNKRNGKVFIFQGMKNHTAESIKSLEGFKVAWVEEAQTLSAHSLKLLRPTIRLHGSRLVFSWNPRFETDPVDELLRGPAPPPNSIVIEVNYELNPWLPDPLIEELKYDRSRDYELFLHVWKGHYLTHSEARVFKNWRIEDFEAPEDAVFRFGADWGFAVATTLIRAYIVGRTIFIDHEAYQVGCSILKTPELFDTVPESRKWPIIADSARPEMIHHMRTHGYPRMIPTIKGGGSIEDGITFLQSYDIVIHPRCKRLITEMTHYKYKQDPDTDMVLPILEDKNNHVIDALRYAFEGFRRGTVNVSKGAIDKAKERFKKKGRNQ